MVSEQGSGSEEKLSVLDSRKQKILRAIVDDYISSAEPVASKSLVLTHQLGVSSATVRNEMAELEELGYLEKPHTSAGRIPSDKGYRAYVDELIQPAPLSAAEEEELSSYLDQNLSELEGLIQQAAAALSNKTRLTSLILSPRYGSSSLKQIKMLMIEPGRALVVVVLSPGIVRDRMIHVPELLTSEQLERIANAIEEGLSGERLDRISLVTVTSAAEGSELPESLLNQVLYEAYVSIKQAENLDLYVDGTHRLLKQPEFHDVAKAHNYLQIMREERVLAGYLDEMDEASEVGGRSGYIIRIGQELQLQGLEDCSFISSSYGNGSDIKGRIAVIGPRRMQYSQIISEITYVNRRLTREICRLAERKVETKDE